MKLFRSKKATLVELCDMQRARIAELEKQLADAKVDNARLRDECKADSDKMLKLIKYLKESEKHGSYEHMSEPQFERFCTKLDDIWGDIGISIDEALKEVEAELEQELAMACEEKGHEV